MQESKDREWRVKERAAAERQAGMMAGLAAAREAQMRGKLIAQSAMAAIEQEEFKRVLRVNQEREAQEMSQVQQGPLTQPDLHAATVDACVTSWCTCLLMTWAIAFSSYTAVRFDK